MRLGAGARLVVAKAAGRIWSTRPAVVVAIDPAEAADVPMPVPLSVEVRPSEALNEIPTSLRAAEGADYLYLRGLEHMRGADPGDAYVAVLPHGDIAASLFVHDRSTRDRLECSAPGIYPPLESDDVLTEGVYCWPEWRSRGVTAFLLCRTLGMLADAGVGRALAVIDATNVASLRSFARAGYRPTGDIRVGRYRLNHWTSTFTHQRRAANDIWVRATGQPRANPPSLR